MEFGLLIEHSKIIIFLQKQCRKWGREASSRLLFVFKKTFFGVKTSACNLVSIKFDSRQLSIQYKQTVKNLDHWSRVMLNFDFLAKGLGIVLPPRFMYDFSIKEWVILSSSLWPNFWLPLILTYRAIGALRLLIFQVLRRHKLWINFFFLIKPFFYQIKRETFKYLQNEKNF